MTEFFPLKKQAKTREFELDTLPLEINGEVVYPTLIVKSADTGLNRGLLSAALDAAPSDNKSRNPKFEIKTYDTTRAKNHELYAKTVITDWKHVYDAEGKPVPYTPENGIEFLSMLEKHVGGYVFDQVIAFCSDISNFLDKSVIKIEQAVDLGKK